MWLSLLDALLSKKWNDSFNYFQIDTNAWKFQIFVGIYSPGIQTQLV